MIHLAVPVLLAALLAGAGAYGMVARRNAVLVLVGAELMLNAVNLLLVTVAALPAGGLAAVAGSPSSATLQPGDADPLLSGQVLAIFVVTLAAAEIGVALAAVLLLFRARGTVDLAAVTELGEASPDYTEQVGAGDWPEPAVPAPAGPASSAAASSADPASAGPAGPASSATAPSGPASSVTAPSGTGTGPAGEAGR